MDDIMVIGVAGGTGSGKTTITSKVAERLAPDVTVITHDSYYRAHHELTYDERVLLSFAVLELLIAVASLTTKHRF